MPWQEVSAMLLREEFVMLANHEGVNLAELCRRYGISRKTGYKWLKRYECQGHWGLLERSRRPHHSPKQTGEVMEQAVVKMRDTRAWGGRKINRRLCVLGYEVSRPPAPSRGSCIAMAALPRLIPLNPILGLSMRHRTNCGKWTLRVIFPWQTDNAATHSLCWTTIRGSRCVSKPVPMSVPIRCNRP